MIRPKKKSPARLTQSSRSALFILAVCGLCDALQPVSPGLRVGVPPSSILSIRQDPRQSIQPLDAFPVPSLPFDQMNQIGQQLSDTLDIGGALFGDVGNVPEAATTMVLESVGHDLLVFLSASVIVTPLARTLGITPILGYLLAGALLGPHCLDFFSNSKADVELGDFGILFLLFSEGLEVTSTRLQKLANYLPLGFAQISLTTGTLTAAILLGFPEFLERFLPLDAGLINVNNPAEAVVLALAGTLSTSAFIFPVLKEREWEEEDSGQAATSILLLQDLAVAPLLVVLPFVAGQGVTDYSAIALLTAKATLGFGSVVLVGSFVLQRLFRLVAQARSTETFVALCLLVSAGMGAVAKSLGLTDTAGAFAAGVLLANTNYRAQIQADILPFKGILLGIFFMDAGSSFDVDLVLAEWPTVITGALSLIALKALTLGLATRVPRWMEPNRLPAADGVRLALLLAGGGEFAFVVLALAEKLGVLPQELGGLLTAIVLVTMAITPILGDMAAVLSEPFVEETKDSIPDDGYPETTQVSSTAIIVCGHGEIGRSLLDSLGEQAVLSQLPLANGLPRIVVFDTDPSLVDTIPMPIEDSVVLFGDGTNPEAIRSHGVTDPAAIFISYEEHGDVLSATSRLRGAFIDAPIYARAQTRSEAQSLSAAGATEVVVESDELSRSAAALIRGTSVVPSLVELRLTAAAAGMSPREVDCLLELYSCLDRDSNGLVTVDELASLLRKSTTGIASDEEIDNNEAWLRAVVLAPINSVEFCCMYVRAPQLVKDALNDACLI